MSGTLTDSAAAFSSWGVEAGWTVTNRTDGTSTTVVSVDSETQLTITDDIFTTGEFYTLEYDYATLSNIKEIYPWEEEPYSAHAQVTIDNGDSACDAYDTRNKFLKLPKGYYHEGTAYTPMDNQYFKIMRQRWTSSPLNPKDTLVLYAYGLWDILSQYKTPVDLYFNQAGYNDDSSIDDMTAKQMINYVLLLAGLSLGDDIDDQSATYIGTLKPKMSFERGTSGAYMVLSMIAPFQAKLVCRLDKMHLITTNVGKSYEYKCPTEDEYISFTQSALDQSLPSILKAEVVSADGNYSGTYTSTSPAWTPDMGRLYWEDTYGICTSDAICEHIAQAFVERSASQAEIGQIILPIMDCCQEIYVEDTVTDGRGNTSGTGLTGGVYARYRPGSANGKIRTIYSMEVRLGGLRKSIESVDDYINSLALNGTGIPTSAILNFDNIVNEAGLKWALIMGG